MEKNKNEIKSSKKGKKKNWMMIALAALLAALLVEMVCYMAVDSQNSKKKIAEQVKQEPTDVNNDFMAQDVQATVNQEATADETTASKDADRDNHHASSAKDNNTVAPATQKQPSSTTPSIKTPAPVPERDLAQTTPRDNESQRESWYDEESQGTTLTPLEDNSRNYTRNMNRPVQGQGQYHRGYTPNEQQGGYYDNPRRSHGQGYYNQYGRRYGR